MFLASKHWRNSGSFMHRLVVSQLKRKGHCKNVKYLYRRFCEFTLMFFYYLIQRIFHCVCVCVFASLTVHMSPTHAFTEKIIS